jgi:hypothetical protein
LQASTSVLSHVKSGNSTLPVNSNGYSSLGKSMHAFHMLLEQNNFLCTVLDILYCTRQIRFSADNLHCWLCKPKLSCKPSCNSHSCLLWVTVLLIAFCSCCTGLFASGVPARPQGGWGGLLDERETLVGRVAGSTETMRHLVRRGEVYLPATDTLLLGVTCRTEIT